MSFMSVLSAADFSGSWSWTLVISAVAALLVAHEVWKLTFFIRHGVKGPMPLPIVGNVLQWRKFGFLSVLVEYRKKYQNERAFGAFFFRTPVFFVTDLDMIKDITVKHFSKFMNHTEFVLKSRPFHVAVTSLKDQHWKDVRNVITPTFSTAKMKTMTSLIHECCDVLVRNIGEMQKREGHVKLNSLFEKFTMDGIAKCAFGLNVDSQNNPDDPFVFHAKKILAANRLSPKKMIAGMCYPIGKLMDYFEVNAFPAEDSDFFTSVLDKTIQMRRQSNDGCRKDFLQLLIDVEKDQVDSTTGEEKGDGDEDLHSLGNGRENDDYFDLKKTKKTALSREEIHGQAMLFFFAGYETTNVTLGCLAYSLATNPEVQQKLIEEIEEVAPSRDSVDYNSIAKMLYLDCVVCETLRMYPPAYVLERYCNETYSFDGITIPKGSGIFVPVLAVHRDPSVWPNPMTFDPARFMKENRDGRHPCAWLPFGVGPRNCIGMRFALFEVKFAIVRLLQNYCFETAPETEIPLPLGKRSVKPENDIIVRIVERN